MNILLVTDDAVSARVCSVPGVQGVSARHYLTDPRYSDLPNTRVFNLCRSYRYQSNGYYVSLLAAARGHRPIPSVTTIQDLKSPTMVRVVSDDLEDQIEDTCEDIEGNQLTLDIYFGIATNRRHAPLTNAIYNAFPTPLLRAQLFREDEEWELKSVRPISIDEIPESRHAQVQQGAEEYFSRGRFHVRKRRPPRYSLAILHDEQEEFSPSNAEALEKFERAADKLDVEVDFIGRDDFARIAEYDALFLRETTRVMHHTYRFARRAEAEGLVVIDDPLSILRCANKVYLAELMEQEDIRTPKTIIVHEGNVDRLIPELGLPIVLKQPDSSFSQGVVKVDDRATLQKEVDRLLSKSDLIIAQEFIATPFDWRIGILNRRPLYACKYYMARRHWQIIHREVGRKAEEGRSETLPVELVPRPVVRTALRAANLVGDGLYGVDLKQVGRQVFVIEVNDNPSIEAGVEDAVLKGDLYTRIMEEFVRRIDLRRANGPGTGRLM